ncbi:MAG: hypothetical protein ABIR24_02330 [Verrucomicrobiota bacterium]
MKISLIFHIALLSCIPIFVAQAAPVTNWHTFKATTATTLSGQGTSSPVFGSTNVTSSGAFFVGYFDAVSLTNLGDRIIFSYQVSFTDAANIVDAQDNFRFALFDLNGQTPVVAENVATAGVDGATDNWRGYWFGVRHLSGVGSIRERIGAVAAGGDNPFSATGANTANAPSLGTVGGTGVSFLSSMTPAGGPVYVGIMALEKTPSGIAVAGSFGGNGATNLFAANDNATPFPTNYAAVAYLSGGPLSCDQMNFQNVTVAYAVSNALQITSQPTNVSVNAGQPAQFNVSWTGSGIIPSLQWRENGIDISGATNSTYTIAATTSGQNSNTYSVVIQNVFGDSVTSSNATLTVFIDTTPPTVLSASSLVSNSVNVIFSEAVDATTAQDSSSYSLAGNTIAAVLLIGTTNVLVTFDNLITGNYSLTVTNVKDTSANTMAATNVAGIAHGFQESLGIGISDGLGFAFNSQPVVHAGGSDIFGTSDQFQYVYKPVSGDFDLAVRVESLLNTSSSAKAGLMARVNTFTDSRNVMMEVTPTQFILQYRTNAVGGGSVALGSPRPATAFPNCWVRLVRSGAIITGFSSTNNGTWDLIGSYDTSVDADGAYPANILIGLGATSHSAGNVTKAVFSGFGQALVTPTLSISKTGGNVELSWSSSAIGFNLQGTPNLSLPITWTNIPNSSVTNRVILPTSSSASFYRLQK